MQAAGAGVDASTVQQLIDDAVAETVLSSQAAPSIALLLRCTQRT